MARTERVIVNAIRVLSSSIINCGVGVVDVGVVDASVIGGTVVVNSSNGISSYFGTSLQNNPVQQVVYLL